MEQQVLNFYPITAGFKARSGPSREAAQAVTASSKRIETMSSICSSLKHEGPATADELAERLELDRLYVRPRVSELHATAKVYDTGMRRDNESGRPATVWGVCARLGDTPDQVRKKRRARPTLRLVDTTATERQVEPEAEQGAIHPGGPLARVRRFLTSVYRAWRS